VAVGQVAEAAGLDADDDRHQSGGSSRISRIALARALA
jgi:hypothetical protein